ncbi:AraC family transcriptional regulator [Paenibacillus sp. IB182496]|uniref:AraC family transcriptional regulator n=1 Tax=Paenibacillus sabuli TaxID=2772509 RepID=A0A927BY76_9BACL|nr:helix-turn-helix domain-containing protein [Paenibacillus sabuli]MBD2847925.1 AraC family transcriptional regulator [Paenibacillus sabuli]
MKKRLLNRDRKGRLFRRFLLPYCLLLLIPLIIGTHAYYQTVQVVREDALELHQAVLEQTEHSLNQLFTEIRDVVSLISIDKDLLALMLNAEPVWTPDNIYQFSLQRDELNKLSTNNYISDLFVYLKKSGTIIARDHIERLSTHPMQIGEENFEAWLERIVETEQLGRYHRLENVTNGRTVGNYLAYVSGLPAGYSNKPEGAVVIMIREQSIVNLFSRLLGPEGSFAYIVDGGDALIAAAGVQAQPLALAGQGRMNYTFEQIGGRDMLVSYANSPGNGWTYVAGLPADTVFSKADFVKRINWIVLGVALLLGALLAMLFARRNAKPISEVLDALRDFASKGEPGRKLGELDVLKSAVHQVISSNTSLSVRMKLQQPVLQAAFVERLLKNGFNRQEELEAHAEHAQLDLGEASKRVVVLRLLEPELLPAGSTAIADTELAMEQMRALRGCRYVHELRSGRLAAIVASEAGIGLSEQEATDALQTALAELQEALHQQFGLLTLVGIGQPYAAWLDLWRSCNEAEQALDYLDPEMPQQQARYDAWGSMSGHYYYPLDLEVKLMHALRAGDSQALERLLDHIEEENFQRRQLGPWRKKQLFTELQGTLLKLSEHLQPGHVELEQQLEGIDIEAGDGGGTEQAFARLRQLALLVSLRIQDQKCSKYSEMFGQLERRILESYADSNLSLGQLASEFKQTESFLSTLFKEQKGITFSEHVERLRLEQACKLLSGTSDPIQEIAARIGYNSDKSFRRAFKRAYGVQPTSYRSSAPAAMESL